MSGLGLQMQGSAQLDIPSGAAVLFNETLEDSDPNLSYNPLDGTISFADAGEYYVSWFVVTKTAGGAAGADFSIVTNESTPKFYTAGNKFNMGQISGFALLTVTAGFAITLQNSSEADVGLSDGALTNAGISILNAVERGATGPTGETGLQGPTGPTGIQGPTGPTGQTLTSEGFSAYIPTLSVSASSQLSNWTVSSPYFNSGNFDPVSGNYTVPSTGRYLIQATINYSTTAAISLSLGPGVNPAFIVQKNLPTTSPLISGLFPILNVNIALILDLRAILGSGTITLAGEVLLNSGDRIGLYYVAGGLTLNLNLGGSSSGIVWSVNRIY